jgi:hypothetical protein
MKLDNKGRCCGRKPLVYKRANRYAGYGPHLFCTRCCRAYGLESQEQIDNWAWKCDAAGQFVSQYPDQRS